MLESEEKGYNSETIARQPFRLSKKWKKKFEPNIDLMDNHLINHNLINHNLSRIGGDPKEDSCSTAIIGKTDSIETDLDIRTLQHDNKLQHKMQSFKDTFKPSCPDFEPSDCPFSCCVFLCLLAKHSRSKKRNDRKHQKGDKRSLKYSTNSIQSNCNTTASTVQDDDAYNKNPTRVSSQTNLNTTRGSSENLQPEQSSASVPDADLLNDDQPAEPIAETSAESSAELSAEPSRILKNTQV